MIRLDWVRHTTHLLCVAFVVVWHGGARLCAAQGPTTTRPQMQGGQPPADLQTRVRAEVRTILDDPGAPEGSKCQVIATALQMNLTEFRPQLQRLAKDDRSERVRGIALRVLKAWEGRDAMEARYKAEREESRRRAGMSRKELMEEGEAKAAAAQRDSLLKILREGTSEQRLDAVTTAGTWGKYVPEAIPLLRDLARKDSHLGVRYNALLALNRIEGDTEQGLTFAKSFLSADNPPSLRRVVADRLSLFGYKEALGVLIELAGSTGDIRERHRLLESARGATRLDAPELNPGRVLSRYPIGEADYPLVQQALAAWQKWWKEDGPAYVLPTRLRVRCTLPSSQPTSGRTGP